jgi:hypothetical protein
MSEFERMCRLVHVAYEDMIDEHDGYFDGDIRKDDWSEGIRNEFRERVVELLQIKINEFTEAV